MKIQFLGQNCFLFDIQGVRLLSDPFYNHQREQSGFNPQNQLSAILVTHAHGDHTADVAELLSLQPTVRLIAQPEIVSHYQPQHGVDLNIGGSTQIGDIRITMVPAQHTSSFPDGSYGGVASGYILDTPSKRVYLAGDTGVSAEMGLLKDLYGAIDLAILPIGGHYTMDASQAAYAAKHLIQCPEVIGCHFDTFAPIVINHGVAQRAFDRQDVRLHLPAVGTWLNF